MPHALIWFRVGQGRSPGKCMVFGFPASQKMSGFSKPANTIFEKKSRVNTLLN
jgi:hypothetical protein